MERLFKSPAENHLDSAIEEAHRRGIDLETAVGEEVMTKIRNLQQVRTRSVIAREFQYGLNHVLAQVGEKWRNLNNPESDVFGHPEAYEAGMADLAAHVNYMEATDCESWSLIDFITYVRSLSK